MNVVCMSDVVEERIKNIETLDLDPIKIKLRCSEDGPGWDREKIEQVERRYRQFLILNLKHPCRSIVPNKEIDLFWHAHILDTMKYAEDCQKIFGRFLHHFPYFGMRGEEDARHLQEAFAKTKDLFVKEFGEELTEKCGDCQVSDCDASQCSPNRSRDWSRPSFTTKAFATV